VPLSPGFHAGRDAASLPQEGGDGCSSRSGLLHPISGSTGFWGAHGGLVPGTFSRDSLERVNRALFAVLYEAWGDLED